MKDAALRIVARSLLWGALAMLLSLLFVLGSLFVIAVAGSALTPWFSLILIAGTGAAVFLGVPVWLSVVTEKYFPAVYSLISLKTSPGEFVMSVLLAIALFILGVSFLAAQLRHVTIKVM